MSPKKWRIPENSIPIGKRFALPAIRPFCRLLAKTILSFAINYQQSHQKILLPSQKALVLR
jgi:hypothetical protein